MGCLPGNTRVVTRVTTLLFPGKQPIACTHFKSVENITDGRFGPYITGCVVNFNINMK
jgi:hypothetical protein